MESNFLIKEKKNFKISYAVIRTNVFLIRMIHPGIQRTKRNNESKQPLIYKARYLSICSHGMWQAIYMVECSSLKPLIGSFWVTEGQGEWLYWRRLTGKVYIHPVNKHKSQSMGWAFSVILESIVIVFVFPPHFWVYRYFIIPHSLGDLLKVASF